MEVVRYQAGPGSRQPDRPAPLPRKSTMSTGYHESIIVRSCSITLREPKSEHMGLKSHLELGRLDDLTRPILSYHKRVHTRPESIVISDDFSSNVKYVVLHFISTAVPNM